MKSRWDERGKVEGQQQAPAFPHCKTSFLPRYGSKSLIGAYKSKSNTRLTAACLILQGNQVRGRNCVVFYLLQTE
jgi:hypothetical protein